MPERVEGTAVMVKTIKMAEIYGIAENADKPMGELTICANGWETRYSWGHTAEVWAGCEKMATAKMRYYNRTWEEYRFQSVIHEALYKYVKCVTGRNPLKSLAARDMKPMKGAAAEARRQTRVAEHEFAKWLYNALTAAVDGKAIPQYHAVA